MTFNPSLVPFNQGSQIMCFVTRCLDLLLASLQQYSFKFATRLSRSLFWAIFLTRWKSRPHSISLAFVFLLAWIRHPLSLQLLETTASIMLMLRWAPGIPAGKEQGAGLLFTLWHNTGLLADLKFAYQVCALSDPRYISWAWSKFIAFSCPFFGLALGLSL